MAISTFTELKAAIANHLHRADLTSVIPDFIGLAEDKLSRKLRVAGLEATDTIACVAGTQSYALPADLKAVRSVSIAGNPVRNLEYLTPEVADKYFGNTTTAKPYGYSRIGSDLYLFHTPDSDYTVNLIYYSKPTALSDANTSNWYLTNAKDALLYASLTYAANYIQDEILLSKYNSLYEIAVRELEDEDILDKWSGSNMRVRVG